MIAKILSWFGWRTSTEHEHDWKYYNKLWQERIIFECRKCDGCLTHQVKLNGPMGDGSWAHIDSCWKWPQWNLERFLTAHDIEK